MAKTTPQPLSRPPLERMMRFPCWGGKGRTGTVIGCYLARHGLAVGEAALIRLNEITKAALFDFGTVPQTITQGTFVRNWRRDQ